MLRSKIVSNFILYLPLLSRDHIIPITIADTIKIAYQ